MFLIIRTSTDGEEDYFGPFPTEERAKEYSLSFDNECEYLIEPLIVPNCVSIKLNY